MSCRHAAGDPNCSSSSVYQEREYSLSLERREAELKANTPDPDKFQVEDVEQIGTHLVLKVRYPSCSKCAYEGDKILIILNASLKEALKWRRIDPHFRDPKIKLMPTWAPSPAARFPASSEGWLDALAYARTKVKS